jgi:opacity protein-like surface antigen
MAWAMFFGTVSFPFTLHAQTTGPTQSGTSFIPALSVGERYDTNVWFAPAFLLPPGTRLNDFATTLQGSLKALHKDKNVDVSLLGGVDVNAFAYNTGLNYLSTRADLYSNLNGWAEQLAKGAQLQVYDYFRYTPTSPGFLSGGKSGTEDPFLRGIQAFRANTFSNTLNMNGVYPVYRGLGVQGQYAFSLFRVGSILAATSTGATFFDTTMHTWSVGPRFEVSRLDGIALLYQQSLITQSLSQTASQSGGAPTDTDTQSVTANWYRTTPNWNFRIAGGVALIEPANKSFPTATITISNSLERTTSVQLYLSRTATPSFYIQAGAAISNVAQLQVSKRLTRDLSVRGSVNFGYNEIVPTESAVKFTSFTLSAGLSYRLTKYMFVDLYYDHNDFSTQSPGLNYVILRDAVGVGLTAQWR